jgi:hypothetical protein
MRKKSITKLSQRFLSGKDSQATINQALERPALNPLQQGLAGYSGRAFPNSQSALACPSKRAPKSLFLPKSSGQC